MNNILITGGTGLVGSAISQGIKLSTKDGDLRNWEETLRIFQEIKPDKVIHCAARVGGLVSNMKYKGEFFYDNIMINTNVLEASRLVGVKKVVSYLSTCVYPDDIKKVLPDFQELGIYNFMGNFGNILLKNTKL